MDVKENAVRQLMDALVLLRPGLEKIDPEKGIDENVELTGVDERYVKAYLLGLQATEK